MTHARTLTLIRAQMALGFVLLTLVLVVNFGEWGWIAAIPTAFLVLNAFLSWLDEGDSP